MGNNFKFYPASFIEKLLEIFEKSITIFNEVFCEGNANNLSFLSNIAKKVTFRDLFEKENIRKM
jgi:hypothetical protein